MFRNLKLNSTYTDDVTVDFFSPVLESAVYYDTATTYFSAKSLVFNFQGIHSFISKGKKMRLIISNEVSEEDYNLIKNGYELRDKYINKVLNDLSENFTIEEVQNISNVAYLIDVGILEIKVAFTSKEIFHGKFGIIEDGNGDKIFFRGSNKETWAIKSNFESFEIICSWLSSESDNEKLTHSIITFNDLWSNSTSGIIVRKIDEIIKNKMLSFNKGKIIEEIVMLSDNCIILDYDIKIKSLVIHNKLKEISFENSSIYKMKLNTRVDKSILSNDQIIFKSKLTYNDFKGIIDNIEADSIKRNYEFHVTNRLMNYINDREFKLEKRRQLGIAIKEKNPNILHKIDEFKKEISKLMERPLRDKQVYDAYFMYSMKKSANFSVPGSGKTSSALGVYAYLKEKGVVNRIVVVGPKNCFGAWIDEFKSCFGGIKDNEIFDVSGYNSSNVRMRELKYNHTGKKIFLVNYEIIGSIIEELKKIISNKTLLILDEVHKVKAIEGKYAINAINVSEDAQYIISMTGTPIPNSYLDIYNILQILYRDEYNEYFKLSTNQLKNPDRLDIDKINAKLYPFFCRTTKNELGVPYSNQDIIISKNACYQENEIFKILIKKYRKNPLALIIRILQLESNPRLLLDKIEKSGDDFKEILDIDCEIEDIDFKDYTEEIHSLVNSIKSTTKFDTCISQIIELVKSKKIVIVWCIFIDSINSIKNELFTRGINAAVIYGSTDQNKRLEIINAFKNGEYDVLITNPHTLAESVSLHKCCHDAIYFEYSYNLVHLLQSKDRIHRLGLPNDQYTQYYYIQQVFTTSNNAPFSLDDKVYERLHLKEKIMLDAIENHKLESMFTSEEDIDFLLNELNLN